VTVVAAFDALLGRQPASSSTDLSYSLLHQKVLTPQQEIDAYERLTLDPRRRAAGDYLPASVVASYPVTALPADVLPVTAVGRALARAHLDPRTVNTVVRRGLADFYQLGAVAGVGLGLWRLARRRISVADREFVLLGAASFAAIAAVVVLPNLSAEYGLLRAFQQALVVLAPLTAELALSVARLVARRAAEPFVFSFAVAACLSLTGVLPEAIGGYAPQLSLNNAGAYYQDYYLQPQEEAAIGWLQSHLEQGSAVQAEVETDRYVYYLVGHRGVESTGDIFPTLIRANAYVFVGSSTVTDQQASISYAGSTVSYRYPLALLDTHKALVFSSPAARVYR
jgi:hypothetical protein